MMTQSTTNTNRRFWAVQTNKHSVSGLFVFLLIATYTVFALMLVLIGVKVYQSVINTADENTQLRTTIGYISGRIHAADGVVSVRDEDGTSILCIGNALGEKDYETRIYFVPQQGEIASALYEQVVEVNEPFDLDLGERIIEVGQFDIELSGDMIELMLVTKGGAEHHMHLKLLPRQLAAKGGEAA